VNCASKDGPLRSIAMIAKRSDGALNLIFDADDTLWDSNIHFLEAEAVFLETLGRAEVLDDRAIRAAMRRHELRIIESPRIRPSPVFAGAASSGRRACASTPSWEFARGG
ncbi:MAG: hypothetical protein QOK03_2657, partial [Candidatus Binataceae bacterium]|nr:hypothetical protein [Candidatus Binataceae bacterium]